VKNYEMNVGKSIDDVQPLLAVRASWIAPITDGNCHEMIKDGVVLVKGSRIVSIGRFDEIQIGSDVNIIELPGQLLVPGLINCHTHAGMSLLRGFADDLPLHEWLSDAIWPVEAEFMSAEYVEIGTKLAIHELLSTGTTTFVDQYYFSDVTAEVCEKAGIRVARGEPIINLNDGPIERKIDRAFNQAQSNKFDPEFVFDIINTHSCYTVPKEGLEAIGIRAKEGNYRINIHLHESQHECDHYADNHGGKTAFETLIDAGLFNSNLIAAHCVCLSESERLQLATHKVNIVHCPKSNMKLANGVCPVQALLNSGVNVALGTDSACSNNSLSMISEMQTAALVGKTVRCPKQASNGVLNQHENGGDATAVSCHTVLRMATYNGAIALGKEKDIGSLEPGKLADMVAIDLRSPECLPIFDPVSSLVYSTGAKVSNVWIGGRQVVTNGSVTSRLDLDLNEVREVGQRIAEFQKQRKNQQSHRLLN
jgi:5-methylthioadenosine/S-adenosylhomocysteine deaminase